MEAIEYLLDTNVVIDFLGNKLTETAADFLMPIIDDIPNVSVISKIELLGFETSIKHYKVLTNFIEDSKIHQLTEDAVKSTINIRKINKIKLPDAIIAATALKKNYINNPKYLGF